MRTLREISQSLKTQDNRITDQPIFIVEEKRRIYGFAQGYSDDYTWVNPDNDYDEPSELEAKRLDKLDKSGRTFGSWEKVYYKDEWHFITACFTEQGCKDYIKANGHNHKELRIYAHGSYRNEEYRTIRDSLLSLP